ncbi:hypothetical protein AHAS_Ahas14G0063900 [Arachis hypogaea]
MKVKRVRPVISRIRNNMDDVKHNGEKRCGLCRQVVHTRRTCTALDDGGALSSRSTTLPTTTWTKTSSMKPRVETATCATCRRSDIALSSPEGQI